jgi:galactonate dehydratase
MLRKEAEEAMKITAVKTWLVEGIKYNRVMVKLYTDDGLTGIGEGTNWPGSPLVLEACRHVGEVVVGEDPTRIDYLWTKLYRDFNWLGQGGPLLSAISTIDIALWDIAGKRAGMPVYQLLGGAYRKQIKLYAPACMAASLACIFCTPAIWGRRSGRPLWRLSPA